MPWIDDPETGTSHYERPKKKKLRAKTVAELFNESQAARDWKDDVNAAQLEDTTFDGTPTPRVRRAGDGLGKLLKGERYTKDPVLDSLEVQGS